MLLKDIFNLFFWHVNQNCFWKYFLTIINPTNQNTLSHLPLSSSLVHLAGGTAPFFCSLLVSAQTLDSARPCKCFYSFLLSIFRLPPLHPPPSLSLDCHGGGFELPFFFCWAWIGDRLPPATVPEPDSSSSLLFASFSIWILEFPQRRTWLGFYYLVGVNKWGSAVSNNSRGQPGRQLQFNWNDIEVL